eukprot:CAMPEP_0202963316 /NCGR_PEP_ID=MMETSP1396-20130829/7299_1 /ASSEMBLY_ACC=CAM_ASM_000872 /TAXON_ID= /ORGANISM="Pseudokeronopsis sp., Strain Brazil" /LENGTH=128 /DNA_ID=CAMNT_0049684417 /DNA_START=1460 /DNA_END=1846 /DNA_ORIENTATION=+
MLFSTSQAMNDIQNKTPVIPKQGEEQQDFYSGGKGPAYLAEGQMKQSSDITAKIEKAVRAIEERLEIPDNNIVEESVQKSMFGIFSKNFKMFKETQPQNIDVIFKKYFKNSNILDDISRIILYFNLPY